MKLKLLLILAIFVLIQSQCLGQPPATVDQGFEADVDGRKFVVGEFGDDYVEGEDDLVTTIAWVSFLAEYNAELMLTMVVVPEGKRLVREETEIEWRTEGIQFGSYTIIATAKIYFRFDRILLIPPPTPAPPAN